MCAPLPDLLDPARAADRGERLHGEIEIARLPRLRTIVTDTDHRVVYDLRLRRDDEGRTLIEGCVTADLRLRCERCLGILALPVDAAVLVAVVQGLDEASRLPDAIEPLVADGRFVRLRDMIEDEIVLAIPAVPRHADGTCDRPRCANDGSNDHRQESPENHPFAVLAGWKRDHR